jgi:hypothetical protein
MTMTRAHDQLERVSHTLTAPAECTLTSILIMSRPVIFPLTRTCRKVLQYACPAHFGLQTQQIYTQNPPETQCLALTMPAPAVIHALHITVP